MSIEARLNVDGTDRKKVFKSIPLSSAVDSVTETVTLAWEGAILQHRDGDLEVKFVDSNFGAASHYAMGVTSFPFPAFQEFATGSFRVLGYH